MDISIKYKTFGAQLRYEIFPARFLPGFAAADRYNQIFDYWQKFWIGVMLDNKSPEQVDSYSFLRADLIGVIFNADEVVSIILYSILNLEQTNIEFHPYFNGDEGRAFLAALRADGTKTALSQEYLTMNPNWRKSKTGISLAPVATALGYNIMRERKVGAALGRCRKDNEVTKLMLEAGGSTVVENVMMYNTPTDFCQVTLKNLRPYSDQNACELIDALWASRFDWTKIQETKRTQKTAA